MVSTSPSVCYSLRYFEFKIKEKSPELLESGLSLCFVDFLVLVMQGI